MHCCLHAFCCFARSVASEGYIGVHPYSLRCTPTLCPLSGELVPFVSRRDKRAGIVR